MRVFWDVDTQVDFMSPDGKLYVPGAETLAPNLGRLTDYAHANRITIIASADDHVMAHAEISETPDFQDTFPPHCMRGTPGQRLYGVRLDTSESLVDASLAGGGDSDQLRGVNPTLVRNVREALDAHGFEHVRIVVSGGFDVDKIRRFEEEAVPVDVYGVGSSLVRNVGGFDFTADIVEVDGQPAAKVGRAFNHNDRLELVS